jgi:predicted transposase YdaD
MGANKQYKDSLFSLLFSEPDTLRELYGAIEGVQLDASVPVTINTLEGVLFMERINDISFEIAGKLVVLIEHQSTVNPNMAVRLLMYVARIYEKIIDNKTIYSSRKRLIPRPEFIVLYNGTDPYPDESTLKLSDSFEDAAALGLIADNPPPLELTVKVYNINHGHNEAMARKCRRLAGYSAFVAKVREFEKTSVSKEAAMKMAVDYCIEHDIIKEFFAKHASEVINMLLTEWNWNDARTVWREEALEEGAKQREVEIARKALHRGLSADTIREITGLTANEIARLSPN